MLLCVCLTLCSCGSNESAEKPSAASSDTVAKDSSPATTAAAGSRTILLLYWQAVQTAPLPMGMIPLQWMPPIRKKAILWFPTPVPTPKSNCRSQVLMRSLTHIIYMMVMKPFPSLPEAVPTPSAYLKILREPVIPPFYAGNWCDDPGWIWSISVRKPVCKLFSRLQSHLQSHGTFCICQWWSGSNWKCL